MAGAKWYYSARDKKWILTNRGGNQIFAVVEDGVAIANTLAVAGVGSFADARLQRIKLGLGATLSLFNKITGTIAAIAAIGSGAVAIGTLTLVGGSINVGDVIFGNTDQALAGHIGIAGYWIPSINTINFAIANHKPDSAGSFPGCGWTGLQVKF